MRVSFHRLLSLLALTGCVHAAALSPAVDDVRESDLRRDLATLASDQFRGREAGTLDELRASAWIAEQARAAGLEPAGDDGTYFQFFPVRRTRLVDTSRVALVGADGAATPLAIWRDAVAVSPVNARVDAPLAFVDGNGNGVRDADVRGKVAVATVLPPADMPPVGRELSARRYAMLAVRQRAAALARLGAAAIVLVSDSIADTQYDNVAAGWARGSYALDSAGAPRVPNASPVLWVRRATLARLRSATRLTATLATESFVVPSVNVIARVRGRDPARRDEHVLFSAHQDGLGVRFAWAGDSVWNGADDNGTASVALLAIGRAFVRTPAPRSALFVWHGSEELGLLGSRWHARHPVVPLGRVVAVLNADMIGRNNPDTASLLGVQPPNRNSPALVQMALDANRAVAHFAIDSTPDRPNHPESLFTRSDDWPYVQAGVPTIYFTTLLSPDYHTPKDEADRVDYGKLTRMTRWMYRTGWLAANGSARP